MLNTLIKPTIEVNHSTALDIMLEIVGYPFEGYTTKTPATLKSRSKKALEPFFGDIVKVASYVAVANRDYEQAVNRGGAKVDLEPTFKVQPHLYATHISGNILRHNADLNLPKYENLDRYYCQFIAHKGSFLKADYYDGLGNLLSFDIVKPLLKEIEVSKSQAEYGLTNETAIRVTNPKLTNVLRFTAFGNEYKIVD